MMTNSGVYVYRGSDYNSIVVLDVYRIRKSENSEFGYKKAYFNVIFQNNSKYYIGDKDYVPSSFSIYKSSKKLDNEDLNEIFKTLFTESDGEDLMGNPK